MQATTLDSLPQTGTNQDLREEGDDIVMSMARRDIALEATWEIDRLCRMLRETFTSENFDESLLLRGLSARIEDLNISVMSAIEDRFCSTSSLARVVLRNFGSPEG
jgi:hypothetical protein